MFEKAPQTQLALGTPPDLTPYPTRAVSSLAADQRTRWLRMRALELLVVGVLAASFMWTTRAEAQDSLLQCMAGVLCGNECVDTSRDAQHCGGCGTACTAGAICDAGACVVPTVPALADTPGFDITLRLGAAGIINSENYPLEGFFGGLEGYGKGLWASLALRRRTARGSSFGVMLGRVTASSPIEDVSRLAGVSGGLDLRLRLARFAVGAHAISLFIPVQAGLLWWRSEFGSEASLSLLDFYVRGGLGSEFTLMSRVSVGFEVSFGVRAGIFAQVSESYEDDQDLYEGIDDGVERLSAAPWLVSLAVTLHMGTPRPAPRASTCGSDHPRAPRTSAQPACN